MPTRVPLNIELYLIFCLELLLTYLKIQYIHLKKYTHNFIKPIGTFVVHLRI